MQGGPTRRRLLRAGAGTGLALFAGCISAGTGTGRDDGDGTGTTAATTTGTATDATTATTTRTGRSTTGTSAKTTRETTTETTAETTETTETTTEITETTETTETATETTETTTEATTRGPYLDGEVTLLLPPGDDGGLDRRVYDPIRERLREYLDGVDAVRLVESPDPATTLSWLDGGRADVADVGTLGAALGMANDRLDVALQRHGYGSWNYESVLVTREDADVGGPADLAGRPVGFTNPLSLAGSLYPMFLLQRAGLSVPDEPGSAGGADFEPKWIGAHRNAVEALRNGRVDAAGVLRVVAVEYGEDEYEQGLRGLDVAPAIPNAPLVVSPRLTAGERSAVAEALATAPPETFYGEDGRAATDDDAWFDDVRATSAETYEPVVEVLDELGYGAEILG